MRSFKVTLESIPISLNKAYKTIILKRGNGFIPIRAATNELIEYKSNVSDFIHFKRIDTSAIKLFKKEKLAIHIRVDHNRWMTLKNTIRKNDVTNRIKILEDAVFEALGLDDSQVWHCAVFKHESPTQATKVVVELYSDYLKRHQEMLKIFAF